MDRVEDAHEAWNARVNILSNTSARKYPELEGNGDEGSLGPSGEAAWCPAHSRLPVQGWQKVGRAAGRKEATAVWARGRWSLAAWMFDLWPHRGLHFRSRTPDTGMRRDSRTGVHRETAPRGGWGGVRKGRAKPGCDFQHRPHSARPYGQHWGTSYPLIRTLSGRACPHEAGELGCFAHRRLRV